MLKDLRRLQIEKVAEQLLDELGLSSLPIDPFEIANRHKIEVFEKPDVVPGASGMLIRHGNEFAIAYSTYIDNLAFQRFTVGHELGHYFIDGHPECIFAHSDLHTSHAGFRGHDQIETEADHFSATLLMPRSLFVPVINKHQEGLEAIIRLAEICQTSLTATAIRYAESITTPLAIIVSSNKNIDFCFLSDSMKEFPGIRWPRKGDPLYRDTETYQLNQDKNAVNSGVKREADTDLSYWLNNDYSVEAYEEAIGLGRYSHTLTVLTTDMYADEIDEMNDEWEEPKFKR